MADKSTSGSLADKLPLGSLKDTAADYGKSLINSTLGKASGKVEELTGKITDFGENGGSLKGQAASGGAKAMAKGESPAKGAIGGVFSGIKDKVKDVFTGGGGSGSKSQKLVNLVEWIDVGVPVTVAYNQWTQFEDWSDFMKKVENVEHSQEEGTVKFKGQVFLSHRTWDATIKEMVPDDRIIWTSTGQKGHLDGSVTFHEYGPRLTKICIVVEYYPQGLFEKTAQIWRAVGRRVRVEMKRYVRHVMTTTILDPDAAEGWRGEIRDEEIVRTHEEVVEEEEAQAAEDEDQEYEDDGEGEEYEDEEPDADAEEVEDEEYEEEPDAAEDTAEAGEGEYEEEPEAGEAVADEAEGDEYEEDADAETAEEPAAEEEYEEAEDTAEPAEEPADEVEEEVEEEPEPAPKKTGRKRK
ncbi:SRPBCC family protein [Arthrobacter sp. H14]|uniref:SRPBCC family protein n=1 Tax=Arthrobacter sp. H14 TaxID=1312959 RepID=UPI00047C05FB|nr:SRPBCC family protein [Arthrobacter sp. H14]